MQANKGKTKYDVTAHEVSDFVRFIFQLLFYVMLLLSNVVL